MTTWLFSNSMMMEAVVTHLWQSTLFVGLIWLLTVAIRKCPARIRFWVWMAGSIKFLVPFALLSALGSTMAVPNSRPLVHGTFYKVVEQVNQPFASAALPAPGVAGSIQSVLHVETALAAVWLCGSLLILLRWTRQWRHGFRLVKESAELAEGRELLALRQAQSRAKIRNPIPVMVTTKAVEPGIFGIMRPVLIWPAGLSARMDDAHIASIVAHELEHVRRRDNLTAALHSLIEAVFWFDPAVWWIGKQMREEREHACDEEVLRLSAEPHTYADSILKVCTFCLEPPLSCVAGVSGSDLRKRVLRITSHRSGRTLSLANRVFLVAVTALAITLPIGFGVVRGQSLTENSRTPRSKPKHEVPQFDVVSIKPTAPKEDKTLFQYLPDSTSFRGTPVRVVLETVFGVDERRIIGAPTWVSTDRYDIEAKVSAEDAPRLDKLNGEDRCAMLLPVLIDRFHLKYHREMREQSTYALLVAKGGPKLARGEPEPPPGWKPAEDTPPEKEHFKMMMSPGHIEADSMPMHILAEQLTRLNPLGRMVVDKTGLTGNYNFRLRWAADPFPGMRRMLTEADGLGAKEADPAESPLFTALQEQLGLKLEPEKDRVDVIVIDHIDPPSPN